MTPAGRSPRSTPSAGATVGSPAPDSCRGPTGTSMGRPQRRRQRHRLPDHARGIPDDPPFVHRERRREPPRRSGTGNRREFLRTTPPAVRTAPTVFRITPAGALTTLHSFAGSDGADPRASLVQGADGDFYGTTYQGGTGNPGGNGYGTIFRMTPTGVLTTIHFFAGVDGWLPEASLVQETTGTSTARRARRAPSSGRRPPAR